MKQKRSIRAVAALLLLAVLIFDSARALAGAAEGVELCVRTVIPSLFPFFVCTMFLTENTGCGTFPLPGRILAGLRIPKAASCVWIPAFLGGYPVGAKCIGDLYGSRQISRSDAQRLLAFCSNAGPSFLFGMISRLFPDQKTVWMLWLIHVSGAVLTALVFCGGPTEPFSAKAVSVETGKRDIMGSSVKTMGIVCGWVILFRMIIRFLQDWILWLCPRWLQVLLMGLLELSNGCCELLTVDSVGLRFVLCSTMLAFGGLCVFLQTASVIRDLSVRSYLVGKILQTVFCFLMSCAVACTNGWMFCAMIPILFAALRKSKNISGNPAVHPV